MKRFVKVFPFIILAIILILIIIFCDLFQSNKYIKFQNYEYQQVSFDINNTNINEEQMYDIFISAEKNNILLAKWTNDKENQNIQNIYFSFRDCHKLQDFIKNNYDAEIYEIADNSAYCYASTNNKNDTNKIAKINDLLNNQYYNYYIIDNLIEQKSYIFGNYIAYYQNESSFNNFLIDVSNILNIDDYNNIVVEDSGIFSKNYEVVAIILIIVIITESLFYFIFQIFNCYQKSKNIGCMKLLGFSCLKICNVLMLKNIKYLSIFSLLCILLISFIVANININIYSLVILSIISFLFLTYFISFLAVFTIFKFSNTSSIIKQENISKKVNKISFVIKTILTTVFIIFLTFLLFSIKNIIKDTKIYNNIKLLNDYAVFSNFNLENNDYSYFSNYNNLYRYIYNDKTIKSFYADFSAYYYNTEEDLKYAIESEISGDHFRIGNVDKNYFNLKGNDILVYKYDTMEEVKLSDLYGEFFLIPISKEKYIDLLKDFYINRYKSDYDKYKYDFNFNFYLYEDKKLNTYRLDENIQVVDSPFLRVVDCNFPIPYIESPIGLSVIGNGMNTAFKIDISSGKKEVYSKISKYVVESNLTEVVDYDNFISYEDYFGNEIYNDYKMIFIYSFILCIIFIAQVFITLQTISLFICSDHKNIAVKSMLGFDRFNIFSDIFNINIYLNIIGIILAFIILILFDQLYIINYFVASIVFFILDEMIIFIIIKFYKLNSVTKTLKGGI